jgi:transaldolase
MLDTAKCITKWAPNIAVKLPVTAAGLDTLEECAALGITVTATVSFTLPQVLAVAERYQQGIMRAKKAGITPGRCFAVIMVGRIDDYIRDVAEDSGTAVYESDIRQCGSAIMKRACSIFKEKGYDAVLMAAGMRGAYHATDLAGGDLTLSIHPKIQAMISQLTEPFEEHIDIPVDAEVIDRLTRIPEFVRAYEPNGMKPSEFITYGVVQKTLAQFIETGWAPIEAFSKSKGAAK